MTLILTLITNQGILQASDSNLTNRLGAAGTSDKVFGLGFAPGAVAVAGAFSVGAADMSSWMRSAIAAYGKTASPTLGGFAEEIRRRLDSEMTIQQKLNGSLIHIVGYTTDGNAPHPELHFVRNIMGIDPITGDYRGTTTSFTTSEDFWTRDYQTPHTRAAFAAGGYQFYINGYPPGRIGYIGLNAALDLFLQSVWQQPTWRFRAPKSIDELALLVDLKLRVISTMFLISDYPAPYVGGDPQVFKIPRVPGSVTL